MSKTQTTQRLVGHACLPGKHAIACVMKLEDKETFLGFNGARQAA
jgi:hypothetical protein